MVREVSDLNAIVCAMREVPSDINAAPSNAASAARRMLRTLQPKLPFVLMKDCKSVAEALLLEEREDFAALEPTKLLAK
jgi:hypothetical protein